MKANRKFLMGNERGDIGVGTLIIFIAMVLVAAVAATVLIYTTGALQQKATKTSKEATNQISSNIIVEKVIGDRSALNSDTIQKIYIRIKPDVGTTSIDLRQVIVTITDKSNRIDLNYSNISSGLALNSTSTGTYTASSVRDEHQSFSPATPVLNGGDLAEISVDMSAIGIITLDTRKTFSVTLNQEVGQAVNLEITTPNSFGVNRYVDLYP
ncbi:MAG: archaellin/type IV pilin N-terminal domain-containing protein [Candidatus Methanoperedens sp.]